MAKGNFDACLKEVLLHEGGFVNHPRLDMKDRVPYIDAWLTHKNSPGALPLHFGKKVPPFIKRQFAKTRGLTPVALMDASMMHSLVGFATPIICANARARTCPHHCGIGAKKTNAENAISRLMARADGRFARAITTKKGVPLCAPFALLHLVGAALNVIKNTRIMFMIFTIPETCKRILQSVRRSKVKVLELSHLKLQSAFSYAQTVTG